MSADKSFALQIEPFMMEISRQETFFVFILMRNFAFTQFLRNNFDFICNNNKEVYFVKMHPTMSSEYVFYW